MYLYRKGNLLFMYKEKNSEAVIELKNSCENLYNDQFY